MSDAWIDPGTESPQGSRLTELVSGGYFAKLKAILDVLEVGSPSDLIRAVVSNVPVSPITGVWTPPKLRTIPSLWDHDKEWLRQAGIELPFDAVLENLDEPVRVLLGGPGTGKTTAARYVAIMLAERCASTHSVYVPVFTPVRLLGETQAGTTLQEVIRNAATLLGVPFLSEALTAGIHVGRFKPVFILDGIDERIKAKGYRNPGEIVSDLQRACPECRVLVTSRIFDYLHDQDSQIAGAHYLLSEFSVSQVENAVRLWHSSATTVAQRLGLPADIYKERGESLLSFIKSDNQLQEFSQTPLLLNLIQILFDPDTYLPRSIPTICIRAIRYLFVQRPRGRRGDAGQRTVNDAIDDLLARDDFEEMAWRLLRNLAKRLYDRAGVNDVKVITWHELTEAVLKALGADTAAGFMRAGSLVHPFVLHCVEGHGVLTDINKAAFIFTHNIFQDVLAAEVFDSLSDEERIAKALESTWRLPLRFWANLAFESRASRADAILFADRLYRMWEANRSDCRSLFAASSIAAEIKDRSIDGPSEGINTILCANSAVSLIEVLQTRELTLEDRVRAGDLLGAVGDPRVPGSVADMADFERWSVCLPEGTFQIGRTTAHSFGGAKYGEVPCFPILRKHFLAFRLWRFPVTNGEYAMFIADGGYQNAALWRSKEAELWLRRDSMFMGDLRTLVAASAMKHFETELRAGRVSKEHLDQHIEAMLVRAEPLYWRDARFNKPNQPVVGINWWEARAYCAWLEEIVRGSQRDRRTRIDLPTEFEWERSGRSDLYTYKPGVVREGQQSLARAGSVGLFPLPSDVDLPADLLGNVWDWTLSAKRPYETVRDVQSESVDGLVERISRGGSWLSGEKESATLTFRSFDPPCNAYEDLGFRVALHGD